MAKKTLKPIYARNSMERFGDDLTEEVLQYLWFTDKVKFECLSKQWQRLVFNKQTELDMNYKIFIKKSNRFNYIHKVKRQALESLLKKCQNISRVVLWKEGKGEELDVITEYCRRVTKLVVYFNVHQTKLIEFGNKHGQWLEEFGFRKYVCVLDDYVKEFLQMCPNIKKINLNDGCTLGDTIHQILLDSLKKLEVIGDIVISGYNYSYDKMKLFVAKYGKNLKKVRFRLSHLTSNDLHKCLSLISRFEALESLGIDISSIKQDKTNVEPIDECLKLLADKCTKLRELRLKTNDSSIISDNFFFSLSEFRSLERLVFNSILKGQHLNGSVECLKHMTRLKHLTINYRELTIEFFSNIHIFVPNIQNLNLNIRLIEDKYINRFVKSLRTMKCIERVVFNGWTFCYCKNSSKYKPRIILRQNLLKI